MRLVVVLVALFIVALSPGGCTCEPAPLDAAGEGEGEGEGEGRACVRTDALDAARFCLADDDCACGAHCSFTACTFDCRVDSDCADGSTCDDFGRCSAPGTRVPALAAQARPRVFTEPTTVGVSEPSTRHFVRVYPRQDGVGELQLVGRGDAVIWCPGALDPTPTCALTGVPAEGVEIGVGLAQFSITTDDGFVAADVVDIIDPAGTLGSLPVVRRARPTPVAVDGAGMSGLYTGLARLGEGGGLAAPVGLVGAERLAESLRHVVKGTLSVDNTRTGLLIVEDPTGLALPPLQDDRLVLTVTNGVVAWPALSWLSLEDAEVEVITDAVAVPLAPPDGAFALSVPLTISGVQLPGTTALSLGTLTLTFTRAEPLPANFLAPGPTAGATATLDVDRGTAQTAPGAAWEAFSAGAFPTDLAASGLLLAGVVDNPASCVDIGTQRTQLVPARCETTLNPGGGTRSVSQAGGAGQCFRAANALGNSGGTAEAVMPCAAEQRLNFSCAGGTTIAVCAINFLAQFDNNGSAAAENCALLDGGQTCLNTLRTPNTTVDRCTELASSTGCVIEDIPPGERVETAFNGSVDLAAGIVFERVTKRCRLPAMQVEAAACVGAALCGDAANLTAAAGFGDDLQRPQGLALGSGDALCRDDTLSPALGAVTVTLDADAEIANIAGCGDDLAALATLVSNDQIATVAGLVAGSCFSSGRLAAAVDIALDPVRTGGTAEPASLRVAHRLLQVVLEVQGLLARNALDAYRQQITIGGSSSTGAVLAEMERAQAGWAFMLDPRIAGPLLELPAGVLASPDARGDLGLSALVASVADLSQAHGQGLSISLLESLTDQLTTLDFTLERAWFSGSQPDINAIRGRIAALQRTGSVVVTIAEALHARALTAGTALAWEEDYQHARLGYASVVRRILDRNEAIDDGVNPLGIDDVDLPLSFGGDVDGDRNRFTAISRFLIGTGPGSDGIVPLAVTAAQAALDEARDDWRAEAVASATSSRRVDDLIRRYGELITGYCGAPINDPDFNVGTYNVLDQELDVETCFIEPACRARPEDFRETLGVAELGFQICMATRANLTVGGPNEGIASTLVDLAVVFRADRIGTGPFPLTMVRLEQPEPNRRIAVVNVAGVGDGIQIPLDALGTLGATVTSAQLGAAGARALQANEAACDETRQRTFERRPATNPASCSFADQCIRGDKCTAGACVSANQPDLLDDVGCYYDGAISEQALAVRSAAIEIDVARAELDEFVDRYDIVMKTCSTLKAGADAKLTALQAHNAVMNDLNTGKTIAANLAHVAGGIKDCTSTVSGASPEPWSKGTAAGSCVAATAEAAANIAVEILDQKMELAERAHEEAVQLAQNQVDDKVCTNDASLELIGAKAQTLRIRQAQQALAAATLNLRGQKSYTAGLWADGNAAIAKERALAKSASLGRFVLSDKAERSINTFRYAQRLTFVAIRAVEYEFQQGLPGQRQAVIAAENPDDLEVVLTSLAGTLNNGTVDGSAPTSLLAVVSLREHLLQLTDLTNNIDGEQTLTEVERFRLLLTSPAFAETDEDGDYVGQRIPFSIAPLRALEIGDPTGVPVGVGTACAERLWGVNAAVIGGDALFNGDGSSFTDLELQQKNTFASQRCDDDGGDAPLQVSSARPAVNLFADHSSFPSVQTPSANATDQFAKVLLQPSLNVTREAFETDAFEAGSKTQLAGRGLYGDYALFIPAGALSVDGGPGLKLDAVDDILLRLDYVAAAR